MPGTSLSASKPAVPLKNPWLAGVLAFLMPGAGHLYQGRIFKAVLYFVCILSTFGFGVSIGEGRPVYLYYYNRVDDGRQQEDFLDFPADLIVQQDATPNGQRRFSQRLMNYGYLAQVMVGLPALPGLIQNARYNPGQNRDIAAALDRGMTADFEGYLVGYTSEQSSVRYPARGSVSLKFAGREIETIVGQFNGSITLGDGREEPVVLELGDDAQLGPRIFADPAQTVYANVSNPQTLRLDNAQLQGSTPRPLANWYGVPVEDATLQKLNQKLGKHWELAMVFTWIAGLLNILAIWDAIEGPAYGRGDEPPEEEEPKPSTTPIPGTT